MKFLVSENYDGWPSSKRWEVDIDSIEALLPLLYNDAYSICIKECHKSYNCPEDIKHMLLVRPINDVDFSERAKYRDFLYNQLEKLHAKQIRTNDLKEMIDDVLEEFSEEVNWDNFAVTHKYNSERNKIKFVSLIRRRPVPTGIDVSQKYDKFIDTKEEMREIIQDFIKRYKKKFGKDLN